MTKTILNEQQVQTFIRENRYRVNENERLVARCIDGRYVEEKLPALALPGADTGQLSIIFAAANSYGLDVNRDKAYKVLEELVGKENLDFDPNCDYFRLIKEVGNLFNLTDEDVKYLDKLRPNKPKYQTEGEHLEGAILQIKGEWGVLPRLKLESEQEDVIHEVFGVQQTLINERHKALATKLLANEAFDIIGQNDADYVYTILTETFDIHLFEYLKILGKGLPIFEVKFDDGGDFDLEKLDEIR